MNTSSYTEDQLVEQPAIALFAELGWQTMSTMEEVFGPGGTLGREISGEVVLISRLRAALERLNLQLPAEAIASAVDELTRDRSAMSLAGANREVCGLLKDGVKVSVPDRERGGLKDERVRVVDWENPAANEFLLVSQMTVTGQLYTCRPDLIGFVNGLPWVVIELKKPGVSARQAFDENLTSYKHAQNGIPQLFWYNAFLIASNGTQSRVGTITADWERFSEWKRIEREDEPRRVSLEVFLCAMCLTGFDAPSCSTIYLDKPMRNHTLMQTIARANRVYPGKHSGTIVDYANVFASLERALAIYAQGRGGDMPVRDKKSLVAELRQAVAEATAYCKAHGVDLPRIEGTSAEKFERAQAVEDAANRLLSPETVKRDFLARARLVDALYGAVKPDPVAVEFATRCGSIRALADYIRNRSEPPDISHVMQGIQELLDGSIASEPFKIKERSGVYTSIDLSKIDFEALAKRFENKKPKSADLERLKAAVRAQLERMVRLNRTRADYLEKFQALIDDYNAGSRNIEDIFRDLLALSGALTEEQDRHVREHLSEEELTVFDILTRPGPELSGAERDEVKKVAHHLLQRLNALLVLNWRQKIQSRAQIRLAIEDALDDGLPRAYTKDLYQSKCAALFEHVYESYLGDGASVYGDAA